MKFKLILLLFLLLPSTNLLSEEIARDPLEGVNRKIFWFNDKADNYLVEPLAKTYDYIVPNTAQTGVTNFFRNLAYPKYLVSDIFQLKFKQAYEHTSRFLINSTLGVAGLFEVADSLGFKHHHEDFALAMSHNGIPSGPYIVLPFLGPSNLRDTFGFIVDGFLDPLYWVSVSNKIDTGDKDRIVIGLLSLDILNIRANLFDAIDTAKESSLDYYAFSKSSYEQYRYGLLYDGNPPDQFDDNWDDDEFYE